MARRTRHAALVASVTAALFVVTGCSSSGADDDTSAEELTIVMGNQLNSYDPPDVGDNPRSQYLQPVYDTLVFIDENAEIQPRLATEWEYDESLTQLTMTLRDDVEFTDGEPFNADAVQSNLEHFLAGTGPAVRTVSDIENVEVLSEFEVRIDLAAPNPALLRYLGLTAGMMASPAAIDGGTLATEPVGTGPYVFDDAATVPDSRHVYQRNPDYWNAEDYPYEAVVISPIVDNTARINALRTGQADAASQMSSRYIEEAEDSGLEITAFPSGDVMGLVLFDRDGTFAPGLADARVRQAMNLAIDREQIVEQLYDGRGTMTTQVFNPDSDAWSDELNSKYPYDPDAARDLLDESGYEGDVAIDIPEYAGVSDLMVVLEQQFEEIGITLRGDTVPDAQANTEMRSGDYAGALIQLQSNDPWQAIQLMLQPDSPWNALQYEDDVVRELIQDARTASAEERTAIHQDLNRHIVEEGWFVPIVFLDTIMFTSTDTELTPYKYSVVPPLEAYSPAA